MKKNLINGTWFETEDYFEVYDPTTQRPIAKVSSISKDDVTHAIDSACEAQLKWVTLTSYQREPYLLKISKLLESKRKELVDIMMMESGKTMSDCNAEVDASIASFKFYAEEGIRQYGKMVEPREASTIQMVIKKPYGVVALLTPWNFPLSLATRKIAPALSAGNSVILKPSTQTPLTSLKLSEILDEVLPKGVYNVITGKSNMISDTIMNDGRVRKLSFTGSTRVGQMLYRSGSESMVNLSLELGGNAPFIVDESANLEETSENLITAKIRSNGQVCVSPNRIFVHSNVYSQFLNILTKKVENVTVGNPVDEGVDLGPIIDEKAVDRLNNLLEDAIGKGAEVIARGQKYNHKTNNPQFYPLTLISGINESMKIYHEEIFGPILSVIKFEDFEDVIEEANRNKFGLAGYVYTSNSKNMEYASNHLEVGMLGINNAVLGSPETPFGGIKHSGFGRENGSEGLDEYFEIKYIKVSF